MKRERIVMHVDLDYFYAQCEELRNPLLKDKVVVVCVYSARGGDSGAVSTCNYKARGYGVRAGMPIRQAKNLLKDLDPSNVAFLPVDEPYYASISELVMSILRKHADSFEQVSIDEAFMDVSSRCNSLDDAVILAKSIKQELRSSVGLTCSIGVSINKLVAKMASDYNKPDGLTVVKQHEVNEFLSRLSVGKIPWVGKKTEERLNQMGITTIGDLARLDAQVLVDNFGKKMGIYLYNAARGIDDEPVKDDDKVKQVSRITTLKKSTDNVNDMLDDLYMLCKDVHKSIIEQGLLFRSVGIIMVYDDLSISSKSRSLKHRTNSIDEMFKVAKELLEDAMSKDKGIDEHKNIMVRRLGVKVEDLMEIKGQESLQRFM
jgi:DNA polymerase IV (DinB-like DNA polymerase)